MSDEDTPGTEGLPGPTGREEQGAEGAPGVRAAVAERPDTARLAEAIRAMGGSGPPPAEAGAPGGGADQPQPADQPHPADQPPPTDEQRAAALRATAEVLAEGGAPAELAAGAVAALGDGAAQALRDDPWAVLALPGVRPEQADGFARGLLGPAAGPGDERRAQALTLWLLEQAALLGHTALAAAELRSGLATHGVPSPEEALGGIVTDGRVMAFQEEEPQAAGRAAEDDDEEPPVRLLLALDRLALAEESLADGLVRLMSTFEPGEDGPPAAGGEDGEERAHPGPAAWEAAAAAAPSASAAALVRAAADAGLVLHTGGEAARAEPAALVAAARTLGLRAWATAWTAEGARALGGAAEPGAEVAVTLGGLLSGAEGPGRSADGSLALDLLVVCDAPLLDVETAATLAESLADGTRLVLSGDPGQLWSAGPGRVFADLLAAKACPAVASRTPDFGPIGELVSGIGVGELEPVEAPGKEVVIVTAKDGGEAAHRAVQLVLDSIPRALGIPADQVAVLTPGHGGSAGTRALNAALKARLNPGPGRFGGFDPGDRVVHSPVPGSCTPGTVVSADAAGLHLELDGRPVVVPRDRVAQVRHGWALTVHQAVGRRWPGVVAVLPDDAARALTRQLVYTAFGRAERHLSVVHAAGPALAQAVASLPARPRTTRLRGILAEQTAQP
ncbi:ATP-binding domain-containing protein [Streptomyces sp. NPDC092296]|uniref:ATP-binding domain-containing protein n=1 Tax=Streptomyces sp. NPDC092296 TaxID=3366012 RepID=UPI0037FF13CE